MAHSVHDNEHDYAWEDTINLFSHEGYRLLECLSDAQNFLNEHYADVTEPHWKKIGRIVWQSFNESLEHYPLIYHPKRTP